MEGETDDSTARINRPRRVNRSEERSVVPIEEREQELVRDSPSPAQRGEGGEGG